VLYVALTRAKSFLDVVVPASEKTRPTLAGILCEAWGHKDAGNHLIEKYEPDAARNIRADADQAMGQDAGIWERGDRLDIPNFQPMPNRLAAVTPSGQEGVGMVKLGLLLNIGNARALEWGTAVHALLSRIEWNDSVPSLEEWLGSDFSLEANLEACRVAARELHPRLRDPNDLLAKVFNRKLWLDRWKEAGVVRLEVWRERRFAVALGQELINGSFDRVVLGLDGKGRCVRAEILDFKTDRVADDREREERRLHYAPQLDAYVHALQKLTALPADSIHAELVWIN
jgi:ATP-dependent exoDNAse (exonuclease V) beta subunit